jgi:hypothetical protein
VPRTARHHYPHSGQRTAASLRSGNSISAAERDARRRARHCGRDPPRRVGGRQDDASHQALEVVHGGWWSGCGNSEGPAEGGAWFRLLDKVVYAGNPIAISVQPSARTEAKHSLTICNKPRSRSKGASAPM